MKQSAYKFSKPTIKKFDYKVKEICNTANGRGMVIPLTFSTDVYMSEDKRNAQVIFSIKSEEAEDFPFVFFLEMCSKVKWDEDMPNNMIDIILNKNVPAMILSYARPIISLVTSYSDYKSFDLPFLDLRDFKSDEKE